MEKEHKIEIKLHDHAYNASLKDKEELKQALIKLKADLKQIISEKDSLIAEKQQFYANEKEILKLNKKIEKEREDKNSLKARLEEQKNKFQAEIGKIKEEANKKESELFAEIQSLSKRVEIFRSYDIMLEQSEGHVKELNETLAQRTAEYKAKMHNFQYENEIKTEHYMTKMKAKFEGMNDQVEHLYEKYFDEASKLVLKQNEQLQVDLEYQAGHIKSLSEINEKHRQVIKKLRREKELNEDLRVLLIEKNAKPKQAETKEELFKCSQVSENELKHFELKCNSLQVKLKKAENELKMKRTQYANLEANIKEFKRKFECLFKLLDSYLEIYPNEGKGLLVLNKEDFLDIETVKQAKLTQFVKKLVFFLIPLVNKEVLENSFFENVVSKFRREKINGDYAPKSIRNRKRLVNISDVLFEVKKKSQKRSDSMGILPRLEI